MLEYEHLTDLANLLFLIVNACMQILSKHPTCGFCAYLPAGPCPRSTRQHPFNTAELLVEEFGLGNDATLLLVGAVSVNG